MAPVAAPVLDLPFAAVAVCEPGAMMPASNAAQVPFEAALAALLEARPGLANGTRAARILGELEAPGDAVTSEVAAGPDEPAVAPGPDDDSVPLPEGAANPVDLALALLLPQAVRLAAPAMSQLPASARQGTPPGIELAAAAARVGEDGTKAYGLTRVVERFAAVQRADDVPVPEEAPGAEEAPVAPAPAPGPEPPAVTATEGVVRIDGNASSQTPPPAPMAAPAVQAEPLAQPQPVFEPAADAAADAPVARPSGPVEAAPVAAVAGEPLPSPDASEASPGAGTTTVASELVIVPQPQVKAWRTGRAGETRDDGPMGRVESAAANERPMTGAPAAPELSEPPAAPGTAATAPVERDGAIAVAPEVQATLTPEQAPEAQPAPAPEAPPALVPGTASPATAGHAAEAAAPAALERPSAPVAFEQVLEAVITQVDAGGGEARLELRPAELGEVTLHITTAGDHVDVAIVAERPSALALLRGHSDALAGLLEERGLNLGNLSLAFGHGAGQRAQHEQGVPRRVRGETGFGALLGIESDPGAVSRHQRLRSAYNPDGAYSFRV